MTGFRVAALVAMVSAALAIGAPAASPARSGSDQAFVKIFATHGAPGPRCTQVYPLPRAVAKPRVLAGAMRALVAGPTAAERARGYGGWFSHKTAGSVRNVRLSRGVARIDFRDFSRLIPNASINGNRGAFYEWLQRSVPR